MKRVPITPLQFESTGNEALDSILGGGIPAKSTVMIAGEPGSGKTVLTLQMLFDAARKGKKCLYFTTLSEPAIKVMRYMQLFDFFDVELVKQHVVFADLGTFIRESPERTLAEIMARVEEHEPALVAIDSFRAISDLMSGGESASRLFVYDLAVQMTAWGATTFLVGEYSLKEFGKFAEFAIADGILWLGSVRQELTSVRELEIFKLRGALYRPGRHFFDISAAGVSVYPRVSAPADTQSQPSFSSAERISTGVDGLDQMLGGGLPRGSTTVVQGGSGAGKTLLGMEFLLAGARRGEKGVYFTLEETPDQLRSISQSLGWELQDLEDRGLLTIRYASPVELHTDRFLHEARRIVTETGAVRAIFDSLSTMALGVPSNRRFKEMVYAIAKHMRGASVSLLMTVESEQLLGTIHLSGQGISFIADNLIQLRYVEIDGRLERAISILKARGIKHDSELRGLVIAERGLSVVPDRFRGMRGVLTGMPTPDPREPA